MVCQKIPRGFDSSSEIFEVLKFALEVSSQLELWAEELQHGELSRDYQKAEQLLRLHNESVTHIQTTTYDVLQQGQDLLRMFESAGFIAMAEATHTAQARIQ